MLEVRDLCGEPLFRDVSLELRAGEIVGLAGLVGAGRSELAQAIFGIKPADSGEILVDGQAVQIREPRPGQAPRHRAMCRRTAAPRG